MILYNSKIEKFKYDILNQYACILLRFIYEMETNSRIFYYLNMVMRDLKFLQEKRKPINPLLLQ